MNPPLPVIAGPNGAKARLCAKTQNKQPRKVYGPLPEWVETAFASVP